MAESELEEKSGGVLSRATTTGEVVLSGLDAFMGCCEVDVDGAGSDVELGVSNSGGRVCGGK